MALSYPSESNELQARPHYEVADIFRLYGQEYQATHSLTQKQRSVMYSIAHCRTSTFGYHVDVCDECGHTDTAHNSCRDRHCPKCQGIAQRKWINARLTHLLPVPHYHVVFTLPHDLFPLGLYNKKLIYGLLFESASETLLEFGRDPKWLGGELGFYGILHTWGQTIWHHVHGHFVVPAGALGNDGRWIEPRYKDSFLFPVHALSSVFRGKFIAGLKKAYDEMSGLVIPDDLAHLNDETQFEAWIDELVSRDWVVYCKPPCGDAEQVVRYTGSYTHRVAISNHRLISIDNSEVCFRYKDYRENRIEWKEMTLNAHEFIKRFLWHILPHGFHKIRHYGFLANGRAKTMVSRIRKLLKAKVNMSTEQSSTGNIALLCPICKRGRLIPSRIINRFGHMIFKGHSFFRAHPSFNTA